ncbi:SWI/SNF-related matrix-associated actin-dependent regulator of chromatin subfamily A-like protein 1 [Oppia nitens]|uniref:SWI/SNF-related matrix-associated actin-dependent regulator of chromatin subfamily A-like protein 1 n=1 Tax=Oppia nitens TaxID=1686743 RepID=UPI0023D9C97B|nr:SWI/SNF-related matrix-associated actin-dependent regulator of chromatin subfamily A-like protein 1 [Oppia nitens]
MYNNDIKAYGESIQNHEPLFPFPSDELVDDDFSCRSTLKKDEPATTLTIEFRLLNCNEFSVRASKYNDRFISLVEKCRQRKTKEMKYCYELDVKHYIYILSHLKHFHEESYTTVNYNKLDNEFMRALMANSQSNNDIIRFIQSEESSRMSIIESLTSSPEFGETVQLMIDNKMFDDIYPNQLISWYTAVARNGKCILVDTYGKSLTALLVMVHFKDDWPLVIICGGDHRKEYWFNEMTEMLSGAKELNINIVDELTDIYVYPNPFPDVMIMSYDVYYEAKDTISFKCLNLKAFIFEDQSRGNPHQTRPWKGLSNCFDNLSIAKRLVFICATNGCDLSHNLKRLYPMFRLLDGQTFADYNKFYEHYCDDSIDQRKRDQHLQELEILLRSTFLMPIAFV